MLRMQQELFYIFTISNYGWWITALDITTETWFLFDGHCSCAIERVKQHALTTFRDSEPICNDNLWEQQEPL